MLTPVILSGGAGSRLWPLSRPERPKQFLALAAGVGEDAARNSLLQDTLLRLDGLRDLGAPLIVCNAEHRFLVAEQLRAAGRQAADILLEPMARNTAPAVAIAALRALESDSDALLLVLPSDHAIADAEAFHTAVRTACRAAQTGYLVTFGIRPTGPRTGYGYIQRGDLLESDAPDEASCAGTSGDEEVAFRAQRFVEKPDAHTAREFVRSGDFFWNSGMFVFRADAYLRELGRYQPAMVETCREALGRARRDADSDFIWLDADAMDACPSGSIDYAVMEKTARAAIAPVEMGWSDVGSWQAIWEMGVKDASDNVAFQEGEGRILLDSVQDSLFYVQTPGKIVAALGVSGLVVVETDDALLIAHKSQEQGVRRLARAAAMPSSEREDAAEVGHGGES